MQSILAGWALRHTLVIYRVGASLASACLLSCGCIRHQVMCNRVALSTYIPWGSALGAQVTALASYLSAANRVSSLIVPRVGYTSHVLACPILDYRINILLASEALGEVPQVARLTLWVGAACGGFEKGAPF